MIHLRTLTTVMNLKTPPPVVSGSPAPTPSPSPSPTPSSPPSPDIFSVIFGNGLTSMLLVLLTLALLGIIAGVIWMFMTGRWTTAQTLAAKVSTATPMTRPRGPGYTGSRLLTNQSWLPESDYPSPPDQTVPPPTFSARDTTFQKERPTPPPTPPTVEDPLNNKRWLGLVKGCVDLFDELDGLFPNSDPRQETANHVKYRLQEILSRSGVETISRDHIYDVYRHQLQPPGTEAAPGTPITKFVSPGFAVGRLVLRPAQVQVANSPVQNVEKDK